MRKEGCRFIASPNSFRERTCTVKSAHFGIVRSGTYSPPQSLLARLNVTVAPDLQALALTRTYTHTLPSASLTDVSAPPIADVPSLRNSIPQQPVVYQVAGAKVRRSCRRARRARAAEKGPFVSA